jgi:hypothetical protein
MGDKSKPDPEKVFKVIADIISEREGVQISVKSIRKKEDAQKTD